MRIHRSFIVSIDKINPFIHELIEIGKHQLSISRMYKMEVNKRLNN